MPHPWTYRVLPLVFLFALGLNLNGCSQAANKAAASQNEPANPKTIDGKVNGLSGTLQLKTDDGTTITVSNSKVFSLKVGTTSNPTELTVLTQPDGQTCTVTVGPADAQGIVTDVSVNCIANVYTLGGNISGLRGSVVLQNNLGDTVTVASNAAFSFPSQVPYGASYATSVLTQPEGQQCTVSDGAGIATTAVTSIAVSCENLPGVSGTVSGLGGSLVLQYNGGSLQTLTTNGRFHFPPASASNYSITVFTQPGGQVCNIANGFGAYGNQASANILVTCTTNSYPISGLASGLRGTVVLQNNGEVKGLSANGEFNFALAVSHGGRYEVSVLAQPLNQVCSVSRGADNAFNPVRNIGVDCLDTYSIGGTIAGINGTAVLQNNNGDYLAVSTNGEFKFPQRWASGTYAVTVFASPTGQKCTAANNNGSINNANVTNVTVTCTTNTYNVGGSVSGLSGKIELQKNGGSAVVIDSTTSLAFKFPTIHGSSYIIAISKQPATQLCTLVNATGTANADVTNISVSCANTYTVGGTVTGLSGIVDLQTGSSERISVSANGSFQFPTAIVAGSYSAQVVAQPVGQICTMTRANGIVLDAKVTQIAVTCTTNTYTVGGDIGGLNGTVVLQNNDKDNHLVSTNGSFTFSSRIAHGSAYTVKVLTQPTGQTCSVTKDTGIATANITQIVVTCTTNNYSIGGSVNGLNGSVTLLNSNGETITRSANGSFQFPTPITHGSTYSVTVSAQPSVQICTVSSGSGTATTNVSQITVNCANRTYTISGTITGLVGSVVLRNNGGNDLTTTANGSFTFTTLISHGSAYAVTIFAPPSGQTCSVTNGSGTATTSITQISVNCASTPPKLSLTSNIKQLRFTWTPMLGATYYKFMTNQDGASGFTQIGTNLTVTNANVDIAIHRYNWSKTSYLVSACNTANVCADSNTVFPLAEAVKSIGYVKASNSGPGDAFGASIAISGDGMTLAVAANLEDSGTVGTSSTPNEAAADAGAVYVYTNVSGAWVQQAYVKASNPGAGDFFGASIALSADGNTLAVGSHSEDSSTVGTNPSFNDLAANTGAVYVFTRSAAAWAQQAYLKASNSGAGDEFGRNLSLAADGKTLAIGAMYEDSSTAGTVPDKLAADSGAVYVFILESTGWRHTSYIKASNIGTGDLFGSSVALSPDGNTLAVGAPLEDGDTLSSQATPNELGTNSGATYIFTRNSNAWTQQAYLKASNVGNGDAFGGSLTLSSDGNTLAVGAAAEASSNVGINGVPNENAAGAGAVYVYTRATASWTKQAFVKAVNAGAGDYFGTSVVLSSDGNILAVGAPGEDSNATGVNGTANESASDSGAVYIYARTGGAWGSISFVKAANTDAGDSFGNSVSLSSDANTLAIGAKAESGNGVGIAGDRTNNTSTSAGAAYLY